jgi:hypothetical protein
MFIDINLSNEKFLYARYRTINLVDIPRWNLKGSG